MLKYYFRLILPALCFCASAAQARDAVSVAVRGGEFYFKLGSACQIQSLWIDPVQTKKGRPVYTTDYVWEDIRWGFRCSATRANKEPVTAGEIRYGQTLPGCVTAVKPRELERGQFYRVEIYMSCPGTNYANPSRKIFQVEE